MSGRGKTRHCKRAGKGGRLVLLFGDQLHSDYVRRAELDARGDRLLMMEVEEESVRIPTHRKRITLFLSAMRHFARDLRRKKLPIDYVEMDDPANTGSFEGEILRAVERHRPEQMVAFRPGEWRVLASLEAAAKKSGCELTLLEDPHFLLAPEEFDEWASGRKTLVMEHFYRWMRRRTGVLVTEDGKPVGGEWNYDKENRRPLGRDGPAIPAPARFRTDGTTREVIALVEARFSKSPGDTEGFDWPVTRRQALRALEDFVRHRLEHFGDYQDAMQAGEPWLFHSRLSSSLNLKLLDPRECVSAAVEAHAKGRAPINAVEGFVRQLIGWREFIRGVYWREGPRYAERNYLGAKGNLPDLYWSGETDMACLRESAGQVLRHGYGHHIQRLMVTGLFALTGGVAPQAVNDWYLGMYVDAVDWVTSPNTFGMSQFADGGVVATKPYAASGRYIDRMSDHCGDCPYDPARRDGEEACPFTTLYWDFLRRHRKRFRGLPRLRPALANLDRLGNKDLRAVARDARRLRRGLGIAG